MDRFEIISEMRPKGDQPRAIDAIVEGLSSGKRAQVLLGVTGSGKTFTIANVIERVQRPTLVLSHNKTLAAQLYEEFRELFPNNAVEYFVSYYDYYQPEAYIPARDIYIEKDASRNDDLDRLRLSATSSLMSRRDVIIVASVSCIFGLGDPEMYRSMMLTVRLGQEIDRNDFISQLIEMQYERCPLDLRRGGMRVCGETIEIQPAYAEYGYRVEFFGDVIDRIEVIDVLTGKCVRRQDTMAIYPAKHYVVPEERITGSVESIERELNIRLRELSAEGKVLETQRLAARTRYDIELMKEVGYCPGIENYSRHISGRPPGSRPYTLMDYFPNDYLLVIDESHVTIPQVRAMFGADQHRKQVLVDHGFRLPSAMDNRPLKFEEFETIWSQAVFVSATPAKYELQLSEGEVVEQIIRPTGLLDPKVTLLPAAGQIEDLVARIKDRKERGERALVTTLTKRLAEDLSKYLAAEHVNCQYLHSEVETLERVELLKALRTGKYDVIVGVNLLREGLDLPEVSLVAILDADKEGFLRSETSLIQTIGRAARNVNSEVVLYGDRVTEAMAKAMGETERRRAIQSAHNEANGITPKTIKKAIRAGLEAEITGRKVASHAIGMDESEFDRAERVRELEAEMLAAAERLEFEVAAEIRDKLLALGGGMGKSIELAETGDKDSLRAGDLESKNSGSSSGRRSGRRRTENGKESAGGERSTGRSRGRKQR